MRRSTWWVVCGLGLCALLAAPALSLSELTMNSTTPVAASPWVIASRVKMKMTVSLLKPSKACCGVASTVKVWVRSLMSGLS